MTQLFRRAYEHGIPALFTSREHATGTGNRSRTGPTGSPLVQGAKGVFQPIFVNDGTTFAGHGDPLIQTKDQRILYSVTVSAQQPEEREITGVGQVHMRQNIVRRGDKRWPTM